MRHPHRLLSRAEKVRFRRLAENLERDTGAEIGMLILRHVDSLEEFATAYFNHAGIGKRDHHNGVLMLVVLGRRLIRIEVGRGLEAIVTPDRAARVIHEVMAPALRAGRYGEGLLRGAEAVAALIRSAPDAAAGGHWHSRR